MILFILKIFLAVIIIAALTGFLAVLVGGIFTFVLDACCNLYEYITGRSI